MIFLSPRQCRIILDLNNNLDRFITLEELAEKYNLSKRTIQKDLSNIKDSLLDYQLDIETSIGKGIKLISQNPKLLDKYVSEVRVKLTSANEFSNINSRVSFIITQLINFGDYIKSETFAEQMFVSLPTVSNDLKIVRDKIDIYGLEIVSKPGYGIKIQGKEKNKRLCLIKEGIFREPGATLLNTIGETSSTSSIHNDLIKIGSLITETLLNHEYTISEIVLQNLVVHLHVSIHRIRNGDILEDSSSDLPPKYGKACKIATEIMNSSVKLFDIPFYESEVNYLALNIFGKKEYEDELFITEETNNIVDKGLEKVKQVYSIDLANELDLKIALGLHLAPFMIRVEQEMQFTNMSTLNIKQRFPLAYSIASDFISSVFPARREFTEDEICYIAIHFINFVDDKISSKVDNNILIISSKRKNETFLMRQKIIRSLPQINEINVINEQQYQINNYANYSVIITPDPEIADKYEGVKLVNFFVNDLDIRKIEFGLRGLKSISDITDKFKKELFIRKTFKSKDDILNDMLKLVEEKYQCGTEFSDSVIQHEINTPSSYFGNGIAILHPEEPITNRSFVGVALLNHEIRWDFESDVHTVLLVSIEKNKPKELEIWNILSEFISDKQFPQIQKDLSTFEEFIEYIASIYQKII
ncbi:MAG TPA: transcription antiterminator [Erysipelothrix sp.]|nr:transcription antiterminator [Erysipelothrix sp.]